MDRLVNFMQRNFYVHWTFKSQVNFFSYQCPKLLGPAPSSASSPRNSTCKGQGNSYSLMLVLDTFKSNFGENELLSMFLRTPSSMHTCPLLTGIKNSSSESDIFSVSCSKPTPCFSSGSSKDVVHSIIDTCHSRIIRFKFILSIRVAEVNKQATHISMLSQLLILTLSSFGRKLCENHANTTLQGPGEIVT